jgi:cytochrome c553
MKIEFLILLGALAALTTAAAPIELSDQEMAAARKLYLAKCAKCHAFYEPKDYKEPQWRLWMEKMGRKSKLDGDQDKLINRYLDAWRADRLPKTAKPRGATHPP